jgi:UDP-N-acetylmuramoylalanine--D-glutamate ligase
VPETNEPDVNSATRLMSEVVAAARRLAHPGDTVLLAPAGASFDQFSGYAERGDAFAAAVRAAR